MRQLGQRYLGFSRQTTQTAVLLLSDAMAVSSSVCLFHPSPAAHTTHAHAYFRFLPQSQSARSIQRQAKAMECNPSNSARPDKSKADTLDFTKVFFFSFFFLNPMRSRTGSGGRSLPVPEQASKQADDSEQVIATHSPGLLPP